MRLSLAMICKDSAWHLQKTLDSVKEHVDEIIVVDTGSKDATAEIARRNGAKVFNFNWVGDFAKAREFSFERASGDLILWLDDDDVLVNGAKLRAHIESFWASGGDILWLGYNYSRDKWGNVTTYQHRERVIRPGVGSWKRPIHETYIRDRSASIRFYDGAWVDHEALAENNPAKARRNLEIVKNTMQSQKNPDPYLYFYAGTALRELGQYMESVGAFQEYLEQSKFPAERVSAWNWIAENYQSLKKQEAALWASTRAIAEMPANPLPWIMLLEIYMQQERWPEVLAGLRHLKACGPPEAICAYNPMAMKVKPLIYEFEAKSKTLDLGGAEKALNRLRKYLPNDADIESMGKRVEKARADLNLWRAYKTVREAYRAEDNSKADQILTTLPPKALADFPDASRVCRSPDDKFRIIISCGASPEPFGPDSLEKGIGGSEEAVILLAQEFAAAGMGVEVYCDTTFHGEYKGVFWNPHWALPEDHKANAWICWRSPQLGPRPGSCPCVIFWAHDVPSFTDMPLESLKAMDLVMPVSDYHGELFKASPVKLNIVPTTNGIDAGYLVDPAQGEEELRCIYPSSPVRGLDELLTQVWPLIVSRVPSAKLDVFYGFTPVWFEHFGHSPIDQAWRSKIEELMVTTRGVAYHGRVGQRELARAFAAAHFWLYPTSFPEVSCITAMKAQAMGAIPVTSGFAALAETQKFGVRLGDGKQTFLQLGPDAPARMAEEVIQLWLNRKKRKAIRDAMVEGSRSTFSWKKVASHFLQQMEMRLSSMGMPTPQTWMEKTSAKT